MARLSVIEFESWRDPKGYRLCWRDPGGKLVDGKPPAARYVVRNGLGEDKPAVLRPLDRNDDLFLIFANTATTAEGVLDFVQSYGALTFAGNDPHKGELVDDVTRYAQTMRDLLKTRSTGDRLLGARLLKGEPPGPYTLAPSCTINAAVVWDPEIKSPRWQLRPSTLLDGLWLQFGQAVTRGDQIRECAHCRAWFESGRGAGRRADAKFCCEEHKIAFHSLKRSKEK